MAHTIYHDVDIHSSKDRVYEFITEPKHLTNWWPLTCTGQPHEGEVYNFFFGPEYDWYGKVITAEEGRSFHILMTKSDQDWDPTSFGFDLHEVDGKTRLSFWHKGWQECNDHFKRSSYCWALLLKGLKDYIENGVIIPFEQRS